MRQERCWMIARFGVAVAITQFAAGCAMQMPRSSAAGTAPQKGDIHWWREARYGLFVHYGPFSQFYGQYVTKTIPTKSPVALKTRDQRLRWSVAALKPNPDFARQWVKMAKDAGMKYIVFTTKHHEGFCLWNSELCDFNSVKMGPGMDMVAEFVKECRAAGLGVGLYYSLWDFHHPDGHVCKNDPDARQRFVAYTQGLLRELMSNYGKIDILWYDAPTPLGYAGEMEADKINGMVRRLQPGIIINNRSMRYEDFSTSENQIVPSDYPDQDWEACIAFRHGLWTWWPNPEVELVEARDIIGMLREVTASGGNLLFNVGPKPEEAIVWEPEKERLQTVGRWLDLHGEAVYGRVDRIERLNAVTNSVGGKWTRKGNTGYLWLPSWPNSGEIILTNIHAKVTACSLLSNAEQLQFEQTPSGQEADKFATQVTIRSLPKQCPDPVCGYSIVKIDFSSYPE